MRTLLIILGGLALMAVFLCFARAFARERLCTAFAVCSALWVGIAAANMWVGVTQAGYSFMEELPIFIVIASIPIVAGYVAYKTLRKT